MNFLLKKSPFFFVDPSHLYQKIDTPLPDWMSAQIEEDVSGFSGKENLGKILDAIKKENIPLVNHPTRFVIRSNRLVSPTLSESTKHPRLFKMKFFFSKLLKLVPIPDLDFLFTTDDLCDEIAAAPLHIFGISKTKENRSIALFPHVEWLCYWQHAKRKLRRLWDSLPWEKRETVLFWRGATSGTGFKEGTSPRRAVVGLSRIWPSEIDALFSSFPQIDKKARGELMASRLFGPNISIESQVRFRYLLSLDGNCFAGSFFWQLESGSLIFKNNSPYQEWYYRGLEPFVHYVPFESNGSDLISKKKWAEENETKAREIARSACEFSRQYLSIEGIMAYVYHLLLRYKQVVG